VHAEADRLPGLIVDKFDTWLVAQFHTAGVDADRHIIGEALEMELRPTGILARDDIRIREREGLVAGEALLLYGSVPDDVVITENSIQFHVDPWQGQKTGFFWISVTNGT